MLSGLEAAILDPDAVWDAEQGDVLTVRRGNSRAGLGAERAPELWQGQTGGGQEYLLRLNATRESGPDMGSTGWEGRGGSSLDSLSLALECSQEPGAGH